MHPAQKQWVGIFLKFQSQGWHSDDRTGHRIDGGTPPAPEAPDGAVHIVSATVNPTPSPEVETVTLLNVTSQGVDLSGWRLLDRDKNAMALAGRIAAGDTLRITLKPPVVLPNKGGLVTLLNADGLRVDGVNYTKEQASLPGFSVKF